MKRWELKDIKTLELVEDDSIESLTDGYARVKITHVAVNQADISAYMGRINVNHPIVPTRIATGLISEARGSRLNKGQRVLLSSYSKGDNNPPLFGIDKSGLLSEYVTVPIGAIYELASQDDDSFIDAGIKDINALFVEDIALAINVIGDLKLEKTQYIVLMGASHLNCIIAELAIYYQAIPIIIDNDSDRLRVAADVGCYYVINTSEENALQKVLEITSGKLADTLAFDTDSFSNASEICSYLKHGGRVCLFGHNPAPEKLVSNLAPIVKSQLIMIGETSAGGAIESAINMLMNNIIKVNSFIERTVSFDNAGETFNEMSSKGNYYKTIIKL